MVLSNLDRDLLQRCLEGIPGAWEDFTDRFIALITHVVGSTAHMRGIELSAAIRDDVVADVFLSLVENDYRTLRRFRGQSSLGTYLVVVARRIAIRKLTLVQRSRSAKNLTKEPASQDSSDESSLENMEEVQNLLSHLPEQQATAVRMYHLEERSYREIGTRIGIPENSVGPLLSQARARLRELRSH
ncbi:MAG: sigma-70 family RNA polymerase sigma factor [Pirellulales bacterium]